MHILPAKPYSTHTVFFFFFFAMHASSPYGTYSSLPGIGRLPELPAATDKPASIEVGRHGTVGVVVGGNGTGRIGGSKGTVPAPGSAAVNVGGGAGSVASPATTLATTLVPSTVSDIPDTECERKYFEFTS